MQRKLLYPLMYIINFSTTKKKNLYALLLIQLVCILLLVNVMTSMLFITTLLQYWVCTMHACANFITNLKLLVYWFNQKHEIWKSKNVFPFWSICSALNKFTKRVNNVWICYIIQSNLSIADTCGFWKLYLLQPGIRYIEVRIFFREKLS